MNKYLKYLVFGQFLIISTIFAQSRASASVEIKLKIVKNISAEISPRNIKNEANSIISSQLSNESITRREVLIDYGNRYILEAEIKDQFSSNKKVSNFPKISIISDDIQLASLKLKEQILLEKSLKSDNLRFLYSSKPQKISTYVEPTITIVY